MYVLSATIENLLRPSIQVVTKEANVREAFRNSKVLQFGPMVEWGLGHIFSLRDDGVCGLLDDLDGKGDTMLFNQHAFYGNALEEGRELEKLTQSFCREMYKLLDRFNEQVGDDAIEVGSVIGQGRSSVQPYDRFARACNVRAYLP